MKKIKLDLIRIDGGTQSRVELHQETVDDYAEILRSDGQLPSVTVFYDDVDLWLADGFHRYHAHRAAEATDIDCDVHFGTQRDAILYSVRANVAHGLRRTNEDKRKAVMTLLDDAEWATWSQEKIAKACGVSTGFVSKLVNATSLHGEEIKPATRTVERNGKTYQQNTAKIGRMTPASASDAPAEPIPPQPSTTNGDVAEACVPFDDAPAKQNYAGTDAVVADIIDQAFPRAMERITELEAENAGLKAQLAELQEKHAELQATTKDALAEIDAMGRVCDADDQIKAA
jgi:hypothetical protein